MKILRLAAENILRLVAVEISPDGHLVKITGKNGAGKSSVLNAIWLGLGGGDAQRQLPEPVRHGQESGEIVIELDDFTVRRVFKNGQPSRLEITGREDGMRFKSPQAVLDALIGKLTFDPFAFSQQKPAEQRATLLGAVGIDLDAFDARRKEAYDTRTDVNRRVKELAAQVEGMPYHPAAPTKEVDDASVMAEYEEAKKARATINSLTALVVSISSDIKRAEDEIAAWKERIAESREKLASVEFERDILTEDGVPDPDTIALRFREIARTNEEVRQNQAKTLKAAALEEIKVEAEKLSKQLKRIDKEQEALVAAVTMPVEGLGFDENGVTFNEIPFVQASDGEKLKVSVAMAMAMNPELRIMRITDGSLLDEDSLAMIEKLAVEGDYQVWIEIVDSTGEIGVYIEDGMVATKAGATDGGRSAHEG